MLEKSYIPPSRDSWLIAERIQNPMEVIRLFSDIDDFCPRVNRHYRRFKKQIRVVCEVKRKMKGGKIKARYKRVERPSEVPCDIKITITVLEK